MANRGVNPCLKVFLIVLNFLFLIAGIVILGVGIYLCTNANLGKYSEILAGMDTLRSVRFILIGCGCFIMLVGLCGFLGACKENRCLIIVYLLLLVLILIANVAAIVLSFVYNKKVKSYAVEQMKDRLKHFYGNGTEPGSQAFTNGIDAFQRDEKCCGWTGLDTPNFFLSTPWYQRQLEQQRQSGKSPQQFPDSCCTEGVAADPVKKDKCVRAEDEVKARDNGYIHADDCSDQVIALNGRFMYAVFGTVILAILLQIICITCSVVIIRQISGSNTGRVV